MVSEIKSFLGKEVEIKIDRPLGSKHPEFNLVYSVNYGYVENFKVSDGDDLDAYLLGVFEPVKKFKGKCIAIIHRTNDDDDKLVIAPDGKKYSDEQIMALTEFQERWFKSIIIRK